MFTTACLIPILSQSNPDHALPLDLRFIVILSSHYVYIFHIVSFVQVSPPQLCMRFSSPPCMPHAAPILFFFISSPLNICWAIQIMKLLIVQFSPVSCYFPLLAPYLPQHPILTHTPLTCVPPSMWETKFHTLKTMGKVVVMCILIFIFLDSKWEDKIFWIEQQ